MQSLFIAFGIAERHTDKMEAEKMVTLNAQIIKREGKKEYAVIPYEEFLKVQEELHNYEDLRCLREAKEVEKNAPTIGIDEIKKQIGGRTNRSTGSAKKRASR